MKHFCLSILLLLLAASLCAQKQKVEVQLNNGSLIRGKWIDAASPGQIKIKSDGTVWSLNKTDVDSVFFRPTKKENTPATLPYFIAVEYGVLTGNADNEDHSTGLFHSSFNYRTVQNIYVGAGTGAEYYMEQTYIPAFAKLEYRFRQTRFSPQLFVKTGYLIPGEHRESQIYEDQESRNVPPKYLNAKGGFLVNPGLGFTALTGNNFGIRLALGYRHHRLRYTGKDNYELEQRYNRLSLNLGIIFK